MVYSNYESLARAKREGPRTKNAQKRQQSFNVASKRDFILSARDEVPGPGAYSVEKMKMKSHGLAI